MSVILDTPIGELVVKLKQGLGVGAEFGTVISKKGKHGFSQEKKLSFGAWEIALRDKVQKDQADLTMQNHLSKKNAIITAAKKRAETFVKQEMQKTELVSHHDNEYEPKKLSALNADQEKLLDQAVEQLVTNMNHDAEILKLYESYKKNPQRTAAFIDFQQTLNKRLINEAQVKDWVAAGTATHVFLSQVASLTNNKTIGNFATGLNAMIQTFSGIREVNHATGLISGGSLTLASATSLLGGAGLVLGGFSILRSLTSDDDNELGEALAEIYSAIRGMWTEMQQNFQTTWKMLESIDNKLDEIELNQRQRCLMLMEQMEEIYIGLSQKLQSQHVQIDALEKKMTSYLDHLTDSKVKETLSAFKKTERDEIPEKLRDFSSILASWLLSNAAIDARTGQLSILHGEQYKEPLMLMRLLKEACAPENLANLNLPLGLFKSLAFANMDNKNQLKELKLINPHYWFEVFNAYCQLLTFGAETVLQKSEKVQTAYKEELNEMSIIVNDMLFFLETLAHTESFWNNLVQAYQNQFNCINNRIAINLNAVPPKPVQSPKYMDSNAINFKQVAVSVCGTVNAMDDKGLLYCYQGNKWIRFGKSYVWAQKIAIDKFGRNFHIGGNNFVYSQLSHNTWGDWGDALGVLKEIAVSGWGVWGIGLYDDIQHYTSSWRKIVVNNEATGKFKCITTNAQNSVWVININNEIYRCKNGSDTVPVWEKMPGSMKQISVGPAGEVWGVNLMNPHKLIFRIEIFFQFVVHSVK